MVRRTAIVALLRSCRGAKVAGSAAGWMGDPSDTRVARLAWGNWLPAGPVLYGRVSSTVLPGGPP
jgi:hypothetical protein